MDKALNRSSYFAVIFSLSLFSSLLHTFSRRKAPSDLREEGKEEEAHKNTFGFRGLEREREREEREKVG